MDCEMKRLRERYLAFSGQTAAYFPYLSAVSNLRGNCSYVWESRSLWVHCANTVTCSVLYIWSHSEPAYWKLFITSDGGETDISHMFSLMCCKQTSYFEIFWGSSQDLQELSFFLLSAFSWMSYIHSFPPFLICFSFPVLLCLCICMPSASRCIQGQYRPAVWSCSRSTTSMRWPAQRQPASHQPQRWSDCAVSAYCVWWMKPYLHMLNFSAAVISFGQTPTVNCFIWRPETLGGSKISPDIS